MRKRHAARPRLESMEDRLTLSALSAPASTVAAEVRAERISRLEAREATAHHDKHVATHHRHVVRNAHSTSHSTTKSKASSSSSSNNIFSQFFKSAFAGL